MATIILSSYVVRMPVGGYQSWMLHWLLGFRDLGHDVYFVEKSGWEGSCVNPHTWERSDDCLGGTIAWNETLARFQLENKWCYVDAAGEYHGMSRQEVEAAFRSCDVFMDFMRNCEWPEEAARAKIRVLMDGEPAFTQMLMEKKAETGHPFYEYDAYYTVGLNIGTANTTAPDAGKPWRPVFDPVTPDLFPVEPPPAEAPFTAIMSWQALKPIVYKGVTYGSKDMEFQRFLDLPSRVSTPLELAISGSRVPMEDLRAHGWRLRDSGQATITFDAWREYIRNSRGEFGVAKQYYVATHSGAFSDRSAAYLASGRPVVAQETGFGEHLPRGRGLFAVRSVEEAAGAMEEIQADYQRHSRAARELAVEYLDSRRVCARFLDDLGSVGRPMSRLAAAGGQS